MQQTSHCLFKTAKENYSNQQIAEYLGLHTNTVVRWQENKNVPNNYAGDLYRLLNKKENYKNFILSSNFKTKDQYYTKKNIAQKCFEYLLEVLNNLGIDKKKYIFIEPSAGSGSFFHLLPTKKIGIDIEEQPNKEIIQTDYLEWTPKDNKKYIVIGNPPFGLRGHLALKFINHSVKFADVVAFILPQLFASDGKGVPSKRVVEYKLAFSKKIPSDSFEYPDKTPININTIFQVWTKVRTNKIKIKQQKTCNTFIKVFSLSDGGTPASTRNKKMIGNCDIYIPSTCFSKMQAFEKFSDLPHKRGYGVLILRNKKEIRNLLLNHNWKNTAFLSTNSALNLRKSLIENIVKMDL